MKNRILEFLKAENKSSAQFAEEIGVQPSSISHIISGRNNPSLDFVMKMLTKYPSLSTDWLLFGKGLMYREPQLNSLFNNRSDIDYNEVKDLQENSINNNLLVSNSKPITDSGTLTDRRLKSDINKTKRIVCFFEDNTFKEYFAGSE
jgi:transcriptional regulator with XRE-family HTH domain